MPVDRRSGVVDFETQAPAEAHRIEILDPYCSGDPARKPLPGHAIILEFLNHEGARTGCQQHVIRGPVSQCQGNVGRSHAEDVPIIRRNGEILVWSGGCEVLKSEVSTQGLTCDGQ